MLFGYLWDTQAAPLTRKAELRSLLRIIKSQAGGSHPGKAGDPWGPWQHGWPMGETRNEFQTCFSQWFHSHRGKSGGLSNPCQSRLETPPLALHAARVRHGRHSAHGGSKWRFVNEAFQTTLSIPGAEGIRALGRLARGTTP